MDDIRNRPDRDLLIELIGERTTTALYHNKLRPLFSVNEEAPPYAKRATRKLRIARELVTRLMAEALPEQQPLRDPSLTRQYLRLHLAPLEREVFACLFLDARHRVIQLETLFFGTLDAATIHPREVVRRALLLNAGAVILAHNHPSGVAEPSHADRSLTRRLTDALALVDIRVLDHLVVGETECVSFAERGWM